MNCNRHGRFHPAILTAGLTIVIVSAGCQSLTEQSPFADPGTLNQQTLFGNGDQQVGNTGSQSRGGVQARQTSFPTDGSNANLDRGNSPRDQLIRRLNARADIVRQLSTPVTVKVPGAPKIKGTLQVEFPLRMRLKAGVLGVSELGVDAGSNDQQFWVWSKMDLPGSPAALYFADHREFQNSQIGNQIPLEPQQLINALGLVRLDPQDQHFGPFAAGKSRLQLYSVIQQNGVRRTRVILVDAKTGAVEQTSMYDQNNQLVAYANAVNFKNYDQYGVSLPGRIELHVAQPAGQSDFVLKVDLGKYSINSLFGDPHQMWAIPRPGNVKQVNLGQQ